jgi:hypothetical protein
MYVEGVGQKSGPCTATFNDLLCLVACTYVAFFFPVSNPFSLQGWGSYPASCQIYIRNDITEQDDLALCSRIVLGLCSLRIPVGTPSIVTDVFFGFSQSLQVLDITSIRTQPLTSKSFAITSDPIVRHMQSRYEERRKTTHRHIEPSIPVIRCCAVVAVSNC